MAVDGLGVLRATLMVLGTLLVLISAYPYLLDVVRGRTRPRLFSWVTWTLLGAIATVAAYSEGEYPSATLTAAATLETGAIAVVGWRCGNRVFERLDAVCLGGVVLGLLLWNRYESPLLGLSVALAIDLLAAVPTVRHAWCRPHEETTLAYLLCTAAAACSLAAMPRLTLMGSLYPLYLLVINGGIAALTVRAPRRSARFAGGLRVRMSGLSAGREPARPWPYQCPAEGPRCSPRRLRSDAYGAGGVPGTGAPLAVAPAPELIVAATADRDIGILAPLRV